MSRPLVNVLRREAARAIRAGRLEAAAGTLDRLEECDPLSVETRGLRLEWFLRAGDHASALDLAAQLLELFPGSPRVHYLAGQAFYARRDYANAERCFRESDALYGHPRVRHKLGKTLTQLGRLDEAESILRDVLEDLPAARRDLAWLYERRGEFARALAEIERYAADHPDDPVARSQTLRLRARTAAPGEVVAEVEMLVDLGEEVAPDLVAEYLRTLMATGRVEHAQAFLREHGRDYDARLRTRVAWEAYKLHVYDVALEQFLGVLGENARNSKFLTALEAAARRCGALREVVEAYGRYAEEHRPLYGRMRRIQRQLGG